MKRLFSILVTIAVLSALGGGIYLRLADDEGDAGDASATTNDATPDVSATETFATNVSIPVEAAMVVRDTLVVSVSAAAQAAAAREARLLAQVEGRILRLRVDENTPVSTGRLLIVIDSTEIGRAHV